MEILRLLAILLLIILLIVVGSKVVHQDRFAIITGSIELNANTQENISKQPIQCTSTSKTIELPEGFNATNCVVVSCAFKKTETRGYAYGWDNYPDASDTVRGTLPYALAFDDGTGANSMQLVMSNMSTSTSTYYYEIVLMKIGD